MDEEIRNAIHLLRRLERMLYGGMRYLEIIAEETGKEFVPDELYNEKKRFHNNLKKVNSALRGLDIEFGVLGNAYARYSPGKAKITINSKYEGLDVRALAAILAHEGEHVAGKGQEKEVDCWNKGLDVYQELGCYGKVKVQAVNGNMKQFDFDTYLEQRAQMTELEWDAYVNRNKGH